MILWICRFFGALPLPVAIAFGRCCGLVTYYVLRIRRKVAADNVRRALGGELDAAAQSAIVRACYAHQGMYIAELLRLPSLTKERAAHVFRIDGLDLLREALARGKGAILAATHMDNVDLAGCSMSLLGLPISVVAKDIGWGPAQTFVKAVRERTGVVLLPTRGAKEAIRRLLAENRIVVIVVDQHLRAQHSIVCEHFGMLAATTPAPAKFALETGAPLFFGVPVREGYTGIHRGRIEPVDVPAPADASEQAREAVIRAVTEDINRRVEAAVRHAPAQWLWLHKRFKVQDDATGHDVPEKLRHLVRQQAKPQA